MLSSGGKAVRIAKIREESSAAFSGRLAIGDKVPNHKAPPNPKTTKSKSPHVP